MVRRWGEQVIRRQQYASTLALIFAFLSFFNLPIGWLSSVIIALVTLQNGPQRGLMVIAWAILPAVAMLCLGNYVIFIDVVLHYLLAWALAVMLRRSSSWLSLLNYSALLGVFSVIVIHYFAPELQSWLSSQIASIAKEYQSVSMFKISSSDMDAWLNYINLFATGLLVLATLLSNLFFVMLARWWQSQVVTGINLQKECQEVRGHYVAALLLPLVVAGLYLNSLLFFNILIVAIMPFVFCGLSILHAFSATKKNGGIFLIVFYGIFVFLAPYVVMFLTMSGWLDSFLNFRKKFIVANIVEE
jgi:hypothetical protein